MLSLPNSSNDLELFVQKMVNNQFVSLPFLWLRSSKFSRKAFLRDIAVSFHRPFFPVLFLLWLKKCVKFFVEQIWFRKPLKIEHSKCFWLVVSRISQRNSLILSHRWNPTPQNHIISSRLKQRTVFEEFFIFKFRKFSLSFDPYFSSDEMMNHNLMKTRRRRKIFFTLLSPKSFGDENIY